MVVRRTFTIQRSQLNQNFAHPELVRLDLSESGKVKPFDIGLFAYPVKEHISTANSAKDFATQVHSSLLISSRVNMLRSLFDDIYTSSINDMTVKSYLNEYRMLLYWCDDNGHSRLFDSKKNTRAAYRAYSDYLNHRILVEKDPKKKLKPKTANRYQKAFYYVIGVVWGHEEAKHICRDTNPIKFKRQQKESPEAENVRLATSTFLYLARGLSKLVRENHPFPYFLQMKDYSGYLFISSDEAIKTPYTGNFSKLSYNYDEGRLSTDEEYGEKFLKRYGHSKRKYNIKSDLKKVKANFEKVNGNARHDVRMDYAHLALGCYMHLFMLMTGAYPSELAQLEFEDDYRITKDLVDPNFRAIKFRAGGKQVTYKLGAIKGIRIFKEYLELRKWVLNGREYPYLFIIPNKVNVYGNLSGNYLSKIHRRLRGVYFPNSFKAIPASSVRKYKNVVLHELGIPTRVAADLLNHSEETNLASYQGTTPRKHKDELSTYWDSVNAAANKIKVVDVTDGENTSQATNDTSIPCGHCEEINDPKPIMDDPPVNPNCKTQYGCLYCEHYVCHADEVDIHKLLSLLCIITLVKKASINYKRADELLDELFVRINVIMAQIKDHSTKTAELVAKYEVIVMTDGVLTDFWEMRLQRYEAMGVYF
ncbi:hypothetical protein ACWONT_000838 [Vibrio parahaemolyticus]|nr:hypothetical protein [Vibrio parahaemolyticus]